MASSLLCIVLTILTAQLLFVMWSRVKQWFSFRAPPRQTSIGLEVPFPDAIDTAEALANIDYVISEVQRCQDSVTHEYGTLDLAGDIADLLVRYLLTGKQVVANSNPENETLALELSKAAVQTVKAIALYAERHYDGDIPDQIAYRRLTIEYLSGAIAIAPPVLEVSQNAKIVELNQDLMHDFLSLIPFKARLEGDIRARGGK